MQQSYDRKKSTTFKGNLKSGQTCNFTPTHYSDSEPTSLCSYNVLLHAAA